MMTAKTLAAKPHDQQLLPHPIEVKASPNALQLIGVCFDSPGQTTYYSVVIFDSPHEEDKLIERFELPVARVTVIPVSKLFEKYQLWHWSPRQQAALNGIVRTFHSSGTRFH